MTFNLNQEFLVWAAGIYAGLMLYIAKYSFNKLMKGIEDKHKQSSLFFQKHEAHLNRLEIELKSSYALRTELQDLRVEIRSEINEVERKLLGTVQTKV